MVELLEVRMPIVTCGWTKRETIGHIDLGFGFLSTHRGKGYAFEAASATIAYAKSMPGVRKIVAIMAPDNEGSGRLLEKLGFCFECMIRLSDNALEVKIYALTMPSS